MRAQRKMIQSARKLSNSASGNTRYEVFFTDGTAYKTKSDVDFKDLLSPDKVAPNEVDISLDRGQIVFVKAVDKVVRSR